MPYNVETGRFEEYCAELSEFIPGRMGVFQEVTIPKGVLVYSTKPGPPKPSGRTYKVKLHSFAPGMATHTYYCETVGVGKNPRVCWVGTGSYWHEVDVNDIPEIRAWAAAKYGSPPPTSDP